MVDVDINVQHALMILEQLKNAQDNVIDVAETLCLGLLRVVKTASPVHTNVRLIAIDFHSRVQRASRAHAHEIVQTIKLGAIPTQHSHREPLALSLKLLLRERRNRSEELHVLPRMEALHLLGRGSVRTEHLHLSVQAERKQLVMGQAQSLRLNRVAVAIVVRLCVHGSKSDQVPSYAA